MIKKTKKNVLRGNKYFSIWAPVVFLVNRLNHYLANKHISHYPQIAILSFDHIGLKINLEGRYELRSLELLRSVLLHKLESLDSAVALDIGANIGNHSIYLSEIFNKVYSFEPNPKIFDILKINSSNTNIIPLNFGLSDVNNRLDFVIQPGNAGGSRIVRNLTSNFPFNSICIDVRRLDDVSELDGLAIRFIKIDVEGHELEALMGAEKTIMKNKPIIAFEQGAEEIVNGSSPVINYLKSFNYSFFTIENRFYFGNSILSKLVASLLGYLFGYQKKLVMRASLDKKFHEMVIAIPENLDVEKL